VGLIDRLANLLAPQFVTNSDDFPVARIMAGRTMASYQPGSQADFINVARTIAFSLSALSVLGLAATADMPPALRLRYFDKAVMLNRGADQSEHAMEKRRRYQASASSGPPAIAAARQAAMTQEEMAAQGAAIDAAIAEVMKEYQARYSSEAPDNGAPASDTADAPAPVVVQAAVPQSGTGQGAATARPVPVGPVRREQSGVWQRDKDRRREIAAGRINPGSDAGAPVQGQMQAVPAAAAIRARQ
jgi:hypothetical protein